MRTSILDTGEGLFRSFISTQIISNLSSLSSYIQLGIDYTIRQNHLKADKWDVFQCHWRTGHWTTHQPLTDILTGHHLIDYESQNLLNRVNILANLELLILTAANRKTRQLHRPAKTPGPNDNKNEHSDIDKYSILTSTSGAQLLRLLTVAKDWVWLLYSARLLVIRTSYNVVL